MNTPKINFELNLVCPACKTHSRESDQFAVSAFHDCSYHGFTYHRCPKCQTIFLSNLISQEQLTAYHVNFWGRGKNFTFQFAPDKKAVDRKSEWLKLYEPILKPVVEKRGSLALLDIGAGTGEFCGAISELGISAYGLEPNAFSYTEAKSNFPECSFLNCSAEDFLRREFSAHNTPKTFDFIALHDVLEHVVDPAGMLSALKNALSPKGKIYIRIPSADCLQLDYLKQNAWSMMAPFHRTLFTLKGFEEMLHDIGYKISKSMPTGYVWGWTRGLSWDLGLEKEYRTLRKNKNFVKLDYAIDTLLENIAHTMGRQSSIFCEISKVEKI